MHLCGLGVIFLHAESFCGGNHKMLSATGRRGVHSPHHLFSVDIHTASRISHPTY